MNVPPGILILFGLVYGVLVAVIVVQRRRITNLEDVLLEVWESELEKHGDVLYTAGGDHE